MDSSLKDGEVRQGSVYPEQSGIFFATLGSFVVDKIHFANGNVIENVPGGSGTYS